MPGVALLKKQDAVVFSTTSCSTHQPLEVIFAGYYWNLEVPFMSCIKSKDSFGFVVVCSKAKDFLSKLSELKVEFFARWLDRPYLSFL